MKIAHFADTHIHNLRYIEEYMIVFEQIKQSLIDNGVELIVHAGDVVHNKNVISPELIKATSDFLFMLSSVAPVIIVPGNHDGLTFNTEREDTVSAVEKIMNREKELPIYVLRESCIFDLGKLGEKFLNFTVSSVSIFGDEINWSVFSELDSSKVNIGLFHGTVGTVCTETNYVMEGTEPIDKFKIFDYMMLGHIHKEQKIDKDGRMRYAGSTIQQGYEEGTEKGYLLWEIEDKASFSVNKVLFQNPKPFQSYVVASIKEFKEHLLERNILDNARLKLLIYDEAATPADIFDFEKYVNRSFNLTSLQCIKAVNSSSGVVSETISSMCLDSLEVQNMLIKEHLASIGVHDQGIISDVLNLNGELYAQEEQDEHSVVRNCEWNVKNISWGNLFNYSPENEIDFSNFPIGSVIGVFGKNASGKSSLIDILCFSIWGKVTKDNQKNFDLIRTSEKTAFSQVVIEQMNERFTVCRGLEKQKNGNTVSDLTFDSNNNESDVSKNNSEDKKVNTTKLISSKFGSFEDFCMTSFMAQDGGLMFISEGSAGRRETLKRMLNLNIFDKRQMAVNQEITALKKKRKIDNKEMIEKEISGIRDLLVERNGEYLAKKDEYRATMAKEQEFRDWLVEFEKKNFQISEITKKKTDKVLGTKIFELKKQYIDLSEQICSEGLLFSLFSRLLKNEKVDDFSSKKQEIAREIYVKENDLFALQKEKAAMDGFLGGMKDVCEVSAPPCISLDGNIFSSCSLADEYRKAKIEFFDTSKKLDGLKIKISELETHLSVLRHSLTILEKKERSFSNFLDKKEKLKKTEEGISVLILRRQKIAADYVAAKKALNEQEEIEKKMKEFSGLLVEKMEREAVLNQILIDKKRVENEGVQLRDQVTQLKTKLEIIEKKEKELLEEMRKEMIYETLGKCVGGKSGITVSLLKKYIPFINEEANKVMKEIFPHIKIRLEATEKETLELYYSKEDGPETVVGMASGSEKASISLSIRLALSAVTSLPKSNIFIMDEPIASFDSERVDDFEKVLNMLRNRFEYVLLITHLERMKDLVDDVILINPVNYVAKVQV